MITTIATDCLTLSITSDIFVNIATYDSVVLTGLGSDRTITATDLVNDVYTISIVPDGVYCMKLEGFDTTPTALLTEQEYLFVDCSLKNDLFTFVEANDNCTVKEVLTLYYLLGNGNVCSCLKAQTLYTRLKNLLKVDEKCNNC